jgi:hypothetical protein
MERPADRVYGKEKYAEYLTALAGDWNRRRR